MRRRLSSLLGHGGALGGLLLLAVGMAVSLPHPAAPWALAWADASLGLGSPHQAVAQYQQIAERHPLREVRALARRRGALVSATQLRDPTGARHQLEGLLGGLKGDERARLLVEIGELLLEEGTAEGAAARFEQAARATADPVRSGRLLLRAARVLAADGRDAPADLLYRRVVRDVPVLLGEAELGRAEIKLRKGRTEQALALFEQASRHTYDPDVISVARLGRTLCLERLGDLDSALAELEQVDPLPGTILEERAGRIRTRRFRP